MLALRTKGTGRGSRGRIKKLFVVKDGLKEGGRMFEGLSFTVDHGE
jgi:hypothetical protein